MPDATPDAEPGPVPSPRLIGRDEMNLAEFPMALLADRVPRDQKTIHFEDQHGRLTVTGSDAYGLPTAADTDVIIALIYLTKLRNGFSDVKVNFSKYELIKLLNWPDEGRSYKRLDLAFNRWAGVLLVYDKCWWNNRLKRFTDAKMHIIESVEFVDGATRGKAHPAERGGPPLSCFIWNRKFIESCQADNLRQIDLDEYFSLKSAVSKRLYRFLGKRFHVRPDWTFDLREIAFDRVGLSRNYANAYKIKEKLQPALDELEAIGFLRPFDRDQRYHRVDRGQWTIRLARPAPVLVAPPTTPPAAVPEPPLVAALVTRGVTPVTAAELARRHPGETIATKIEVFDWLVERRDKRVAKSPAGYLVQSIVDDYAAPRGFIARAERERRAAAQRAREHEAAEAQRHQREQADRARAERAVIDAYWEALSKEQRHQLDCEARAAATPEERVFLEGSVTLRRYATRVLRDRLIRARLQAAGHLPDAEG